MKNNKIFSILFVVLMIFSFIPLSVSAEDTYEVAFIDNANIISPEHERDITQMANGYKDSLEMDIVFVTTTYTNGKSTMEYADDFYDGLEGDHKYNEDGILFLIDLDNGEVYISTAGRAIKLMSDSEIEVALDQFFYKGGSDNYAAATYAMSENAFQNMSYWMSKGGDGTWFYIKPTLGQILVSIVLTLGVLLISYKKHNKANKTVSATQYISKDGYKLLDKKVNFVREYSNVQRGYYKQTSSSSGGHRSGSSHRSSSGRSHGGGGRKL